MREVIYVPKREKFSIRYRYTQFGLFYFFRNIWRMEVRGRLLQKLLFGLTVQLLLMSPVAIIADIAILLIWGIGIIISELYTSFLRPVAQKIIFALTDAIGRAISWIIVFIALLLIFWYYPELRELAEKIIGK